MRTSWIGFLLLLPACSGEVREAPMLCAMISDRSQPLAPAPSGIRYFPEAASKPRFLCPRGFSTRCQPAVASFENDWYGRFWEAAQEPSLAQGHPVAGDFVIRFTHLPTFDSPVIVRIVKQGSEMLLVAKRLSGQGGYDPGQITQQIRRPLTGDEQQRLLTLLAREQPFDLPAVDCVQGLDGSRWIVERAEADGYTYVNRWSPRDGAVHALGTFALGLTGWTLEIY